MSHYAGAVIERQGRTELRGWVLPEARRSALSGGVAIAASGVLTSLWLVRDASLRPHAATVAFVLAWTVFTFLHLSLTRRAYRDLDETRLRQALLPERQPLTAEARGRRARVRRLREQLWDRWWRADVPAWSVQVSALALAVVVLIIAVPTLRDSPLLLACTLAMVAGSWANIVVMYAIHYARADLRSPSLDFAGDDPRAFVDYLYFALMIQATFGTTDITVLTTAMRRTVMVQTCLAFLFNTVIVALVVSLILGTIA